MSNLKKYKHFIFDFDGVICDSLQLAIQIFNEIRAQKFPQLPEVKSKQDMTIVYSGLLKNCLNEWIGQEGTKEFFNLHSAKMQDSIQLLKPFDDVIDIMNSLGRKNLSIVTSSYSQAVINILEKDPNFELETIYKILGRELHKSKTDKINDILRDLNITNTDSIYIGDLVSDIIYCKDVPIDIISVGYGYHTSQYLKTFEPTFYVDSVQELGILLNRIN